MVTVSFSKRDFVWVSLVIVLIGVGFVVSIGSESYLIHGHDAGELDVGGGSTPTGTVSAYAGSSAPVGYLLADGSSVSRATYSDLFAVIGITYGSVDSSTFNVPDFRGRSPVGLDSGASVGGTLGGKGGDANGVASHSHGSGILMQSGGFKINSVTGGGMIGVNGRGAISSTGSTNGNMHPYLTVNYIIKV